MYGYGRNPAFWFTLNFPFNYLYEVHRFADAVAELQSYGVPRPRPDERDAYAAHRDAVRALGKRGFFVPDVPWPPELGPPPEEENTKTPAPVQTRLQQFLRRPSIPATPVIVRVTTRAAAGRKIMRTLSFSCTRYASSSS